MVGGKFYMFFFFFLTTIKNKNNSNNSTSNSKVLCLGIPSEVSAQTGVPTRWPSEMDIFETLSSKSSLGNRTVLITVWKAIPSGSPTSDNAPYLSHTLLLHPQSAAPALRSPQTLVFPRAPLLSWEKHLQAFSPYLSMSPIPNPPASGQTALLSFKKTNIQPPAPDTSTSDFMDRNLTSSCSLQTCESHPTSALAGHWSWLLSPSPQLPPFWPHISPPPPLPAPPPAPSPVPLTLPHG